MNDITIIILAGGRGRRMRGRNKGLIPLNGRPLITYVLDSIPDTVKHIYISANEDIDSYKEFGYPVISDRHSEFQGPLAGIYACLQQVTTPYCQILPCDAPFIPGDLIEILNKNLIAADKQACIPYDNRLQPLFMQMKIEVRQSLQSALEAGERKVLRWVEQLDYERVDFPSDTRAFTNINDPEMLENAERILRPN